MDSIWDDDEDLDGDELRDRIENYSIEEKVNSLLVLPYVDHTAGLSFQIVTSCLWEEDKVLLYEIEDSFQMMATCRWGNIKDVEFEYLENLKINTDFDLKKYTSRAMDIFKHYNENEKLLILRALPILDELRDQEFPDDILVIFFKEGFGAEGMWVRYEDYNEEHDIFGTLLNQPNQDLGINKGDKVKFSFTKNQNDEIVCFCNLN